MFIDSLNQIRRSLWNGHHFMVILSPFPSCLATLFHGRLEWNGAL